MRVGASGGLAVAWLWGVGVLVGVWVRVRASQVDGNDETRKGGGNWVIKERRGGRTGRGKREEGRDCAKGLSSAEAVGLTDLLSSDRWQFFLLSLISPIGM